MTTNKVLTACCVVFVLLGSLLLSTTSGGRVDAHESSYHLDLKPQTASSKAAVLFQGNLIADIAEKAAPAVVKLEVERAPKAGSQNSNEFKKMFKNAPGFENFQFFFNGGIPFQKMFSQPRTNSGSGFIVRPDGYIVTNAHVVKDATSIVVQLNDKKVYPAKIIGTDTFSDLAVIKIDVKDLPTLKIGSSTNLRPGEFVIAIGSPLGYDQSVTLGIISAVERTLIDINGNINFIQTDAAINRGNSGGPLINLDGEVIGVNTALRAYAQTIGFSIPANIAKSVTDDLIAHKKIMRPYIGIGMQIIDDDLLKTLGLDKDTKGIYIKKIFTGPAETAGLKEGDILSKIEGTEVKTPKDIQKLVKSHRVGDTLDFYVIRKGVGKSIPVKIGEYPDPSVVHNQ